MKSSFWIYAFGSLALVAACQASHPDQPPAESPRAASGITPGAPQSDAPAQSELGLEDAVLATFFDDDIPRSSGGYTYSYGGKTSNKILPSGTPGNGAVFAAFFEDDYSGVNISFGGHFIDLRPYRKTGSLSFWVKGGPAAQKFMVGLMDSQGNGIKAQTKVSGDSYAVVQEGQWLRCRIPLKAFTDDGVYWDSQQSREIAAKMDWSKIQDFRISINRGENKVLAGQPVVFYLDQIQLTKTAKGIPDPDAYWDAFDSKAPSQLVTDFTKWGDQWHAQHGSSADIQVAVGALPKNAPPAVKGQALKVTFKPGDWSDAYIEAPNAPGMPRDWSKHYGLTVWLYTDKPYQAFDITIRDRDQELFISKAGAARGWNQILVPFRNFTKFQYYQPPAAKPNNRLDLDGVTWFGIKPGGDTPGAMYLANLELSNVRQLAAVKAPAELPAVFQADLTKTVQAIPEIYGVNVGLWAPDLIDSESLPLEKQLGLGVVRYPGGLRADEEDWQKTLEAKDINIDTDEFLDWCAKIGCKPLFTANVGDGSPEMAAAWVKYVNQTRKAGPKVQLWEIGNEIYGNWHRYYAKWGKDGGTSYGKAVRAFVKAMKAADPTIKISAVWMLNGPWNRAVFKEIADVIDAVSVHHYAQHARSESTLGLLAASSEVDQLMQDVQKQVLELGVKGKRYETWLTEWNSVDENPGPQILQHENGLFVADYLGHLAQSPIQIANLWALYNGRDKRLGDYSLVALKGDVQGFNFRRPSYWAFRMLANSLTGTLLQGKSNQEALSGWISKRPDGKLALVFVNKNFDTEYKTTLKVPGLKGEATVETLTVENSGGLLGSEPTGKTHASSGPKSQKLQLRDGSLLVVPKASVVTVRF
ncbi:MAG TPA: carbohydrate binding domain-containing protein [Polyangiaceae bacterium]|nr:carbohydrate binding domain-containing protein [Polyangiaceae bacterium]